jgi:hypothetical protein
MELLLIIAEYLYIMNKRGTLVSLMAVCNTLNAEVAAIFWRRIVCDNDRALDLEGSSSNGKRQRKPSNELPLDKWRNTK